MFDLQTMRTEFLRVYGLPYKRVVHELVRECVACFVCAEAHAPRTYDCSDLAYHLFDMIGHVRSDVNIRIFGDDFVRLMTSRK